MRVVRYAGRAGPRLDFLNPAHLGAASPAVPGK